MISDIYGPNTVRVAAFIENLRRATPAELNAAHDAWDATWHAAQDAAWNTALVAASDAARYAALDAASDATQNAARNAVYSACALVVEDLITPEQFRLLATGYESFLPEAAKMVKVWGKTVEAQKNAFVFEKYLNAHFKEFLNSQEFRDCNSKLLQELITGEKT
jgi:hypothetical protein